MKNGIIRMSLPVGALAALVNATPAVSQSAAAMGIESRCRDFAGDRFSGGYAYEKTPDAATYIVSSKVVLAAEGLPAHCEVTGYIAPQIMFAVRMPTKEWNGKVLVTGCGAGYCGSTTIDSVESQEALRRGYAVTTSDSGHRSSRLDAKWALNNLQGKLDFAYRAVHVNTVIAKRMVEDFYGYAAKRSYFQGCSTGGRQGLMSAQRFPHDFDGIIAGAPALNTSTSAFHLLSAGLANIDAQGKEILRSADAASLHAAVVAACDATDGLKDGFFGDPRQCKFEPAEIQCRSGQAGECLTAAQVDAARSIYRGPVSSSNKMIHLSGMPLGSELTWNDAVIGKNGQPGYNVPYMVDWFRYMADPVDAGQKWQVGDLNWDTEPNRAGGMAAVYNADNPDLREFKQSGGKLIHYHGWQDSAAVPLESVDYFEATTRAMGGLATTRDFYRLFMIPGMGHCDGGAGASAIDYLGYLENWVEKGIAPDAMLGRHLEHGNTVFSRPHFPYPQSARYKGTGDKNDAASFSPIGDRMTDQQRQ